MQEREGPLQRELRARTLPALEGTRSLVAPGYLGAAWEPRKRRPVLLLALAALALIAAALLALDGSRFESDESRGGPAAASVPATNATPQADASRLAGAPLPEATRKRALSAYGNLPISFVPNKGQTDKRVRYYVQGSGHAFYFTPEKAVLSFTKKERGVALHLTPLGANPGTRLEASDRGEGTINRIVGDESYKLPTYQRLTYRDIWPGIDLVFRGRGGALKYELHLQPGADPSKARLAYRGADGLSLGRGGSLLISTPIGTLKDSRPRSYQRIGGKRVPIESRYALADESYGFALGRYDHRRPLVIDPGLEYSTFLGGSSNDCCVEDAFAIAVDGQGHAYVTGGTQSTDFPTTPGAYDPSFNGGGPPTFEAFVTKLSTDGSTLDYSTYLGGSTSYEFGFDIAVDDSGNAYVAGVTHSTDFPTTPGAFDTTPDDPCCENGFVTKLSADGSQLVYSTYLGGDGSSDTVSAIAVDALGSAYVTGNTGNPGFPTTPGAFEPELDPPSQEAFVTKLTPDGSDLAYSTFLGGAVSDDPNFPFADDLGLDIAVDALGNAYVAGESNSADFPTTSGAKQPDPAGGFDAFATKLNPAGSAPLLYSTFLGGTSFDYAIGIAVDGQGSAYLTGATESSDFPTTAGAHDTALGGPRDAYVTKLNGDGSDWTYSTYLGGADDDLGNGIAVDGVGRAYVGGATNSTDFPTTPGAYSTNLNNVPDAFTLDGFVTRLNSAGSLSGSDAYSTYLGGNSFDRVQDVAVDGQGDVFASGSTQSANYPTTPGAFDTTFEGQIDAFVSKLTIPKDLLSLTKSDSPDPVPIGQALTYTLTVQNNGASTANAVTVEDVLPEEVRFESATPSQGDCTRVDRTVTCELGSLAAGNGATVDIVVTPLSDGTITNTASVSAAEPDEVAANNAAEESTTVETSDSVSVQDVPPGETVKTGTTPTEDDKLVTLVTTPQDGQVRDVSVAEKETTQGAPPDFLFLGQQVDITVTPDASPENPLELKFRIDASLLPNSVDDPGDVKVFKDGQLVAECPGSTVAIPDDPCVSERRVLDPSCTDFPCDIEITVLTSSASAWNFGVRQGPGPPASLSLNPPSATNVAGQMHCVTATVRDSSGTPTPNRSVVFRVGGANPRGPATRATNSNGRASFCYTGTRAGNDTIRAFADTDGSGSREAGEPVDTATKTYTAAEPATLTLAPKSASNVAGTKHCVSATVRDRFGNPASNRNVVFTVRGANRRGPATRTTSGSGKASFCYVGTRAGTDTIKAFADTDESGAQGATEPGSTATKVWVAAAPATLALSPESSTNTVGTRHCVTATVRDAFGNPTPNRVVRFRVRGSVTKSGSATTNESGRATFCYLGPEMPGSDTIRAFADTDKDRVQDEGEPFDTATKSWTLPSTTPGCEIKITDGGRITADNGDSATFGGSATAADGGVQGQQQYQDRGPAANLNVKSTTVLALRCSSDQKGATVFGRATINGTGSFSYKIEVQDLNEPGIDIDTYRILLSTGYDSGRHTLEGGNVQIHGG